MPPTIGPEAAQAALSLLASHPHAPLLDALSLVMQGRQGAMLDAAAPWLQPSSPFGQVLAGAFDRGMTPAEWALWTVPPADPALREALATVWREQVLERFAEKFGLQLVG
jgi:hypothetical protein